MGVALSVTLVVTLRAVISHLYIAEGYFPLIYLVAIVNLCKYLISYLIVSLSFSIALYMMQKLFGPTGKPFYDLF